MSESVTTSIRLSPRLRKALELRAKREGRGKNWIISQALEQYLEMAEADALAEEARRQSLRVSSEVVVDWAADADLDQWQ